MIVTIIVLMVVSLYSYSIGLILGVGRGVEPRPRITDLVLVAVIWVLAILGVISANDNAEGKWRYFVFVAVAFFIGLNYSQGINHFGEVFRKKKQAKVGRNYWHRWLGFSKRVGIFQSMVILSLFYFTFVMPVAMAVKVFADPLRIKHKNTESCWLNKSPSVGLDDFKRQF